ncbi:MAG: GDP-mannose 4,6-dehydratase [Ginsengibacter sp.]
MTALIFGAAGQDGYYLTELLHRKNFEVIGVSRSNGFVKIDVINNKDVGELIKNAKPQYIFHLAANSTTRHDAMFENHATIATGTLNILEAVKSYSPESKVFISGSGLQFKNENKPIKETDPFEARDPYCISRIQSVYAARYFRTLGLKVYVGYFFNHDSPRRTERHMSKKIALTARNVSQGKNAKVEVGDLDVIKEWAFAGDIVRALWSFVSQDAVFEMNISSGIGYSIRQWVEECFNIIGKDFTHYIIGKPDFTAEYQMLVSDASLIKSLGFLPEVSFHRLAEMMVLGETSMASNK